MDNVTRTHPVYRDAPPLALPVGPVPGLSRTARQGRAFAQDLIRGPLPDLHDRLRRLVDLAGRTESFTTRRLRAVVVLLAAARAIAQSDDRRAKRVPPTFRQWLKGSAVNVLTLLLPRLDSRARRRLRSPAGLPAELQRPWQEAYAAAVATARVASACRELGAEVHLARPEERLALHIDLIVRTREASLCLGVHPDADGQRFTAVRLPDPAPPFRMLGEHDRLRLGARLLAQIGGGCWAPVDVAVGEPYGIETLTLPRHARRTLARLLTEEGEAAQDAA